ncbi:MAG: putative hydrolase of the superfamily [Sphingomonadales bacterium]|jgi:putative hydrolase of the HAD superfamily|nr:putative hydrolase of the superfamily [Sphingomonadales bacterium]
MLPELRHIESWIFDLDNSLYPASADLFALIDRRMGEFIQRLLGCDAAEARRVQKGYFHEHGTTLAGLMRSHGTDPREFLEFVHDIDLARLSADPRTVAALDRLPGRKFVFTNADEGYAARVLDRLGLANAFDGVHDIHAMDYLPKPQPAAYAALCARYAIDPARALFVEDMARNLEPAKALGMTTVWVDNGSEQAGRDADPAFIDYRTDDIGAWLEAITKEEVE